MFGGMSGEWFWLSTYPIDVCKTRIQSDSFDEPRYKGIIDTFVKTYKSEGSKGFTKGLLPCMTRTIFSSGTTLGAYETVMKIINSIMETVE